MLKDKFAFIERKRQQTAIRNEQDELRMHGATRTLQTLCSLSHPGLMLREKDSERCRCSDSDKEEKICAKR